MTADGDPQPTPEEPVRSTDETHPPQSPSWLWQLTSALGRPFREFARLWRRSIQARVVIGTLALSAVLAILAGWVMLSRITDGVVDSREQTALSQAAAGAETAQSSLDA